MSSGSLGTVLDRVGRLVAAGTLPIVVLDLDSTVFDTAARHHRILQDFAATHPDPALRALAAEVALDDLGYDVDAPLRARGFDDEAVLGELLAFWRARFFTSEYCVLDQPAPGAVTFARRLVQAGALVYYLTGRPLETMAAGTLQSLVAHGFPVLRGRAVLHMKPNARLSDRLFKELAVDEIASLRGTVVATVENEPGHAALFVQRFPDALHLLYGTVRSPSAPEPHPALVPIGSFHV